MASRFVNSVKGASFLLLAIVLAACSQQTALPEEDETLGAQAGCRYIFVRGVYLDNDREPAWKGDPEVMVVSKVRNSGAERRIPFAHVNDEGKWYWANTYIGCADRDALFEWYERDGNNFDVDVVVKGVKFGTKISDGDDVYGEALMPLWDLRPWPIEVDVGDARFKVCAVPFLKKGASGNSVKQLQRRLLAYGGTPAYYIRTSGGADGYFGEGTRKAVIAFQKIKFPNQPGEWDGLVGSQTWGKLGC